jgi:RHS repeat-associated protein
VIKIVGVSNGLAEVDSDGDDRADNALNIDDAQNVPDLAQLYEPGKTLWRVPVQHFTPWDCNWPYGPPARATAPQLPRPSANGGNSNEHCDDPSLSCGSLIELENQTLGESVPITGTPFSLNYRSERVTGRSAILTIPLTGSELPQGIKEVLLNIDYGGQHISQRFPAIPNQTKSLKLPIQNTYGHNQSAKAKVSVGYTYDAVYYNTPPDYDRAFGLIDSITEIRARQEVVLFTVSMVEIDSIEKSKLALPFSGWALNVLHGYDPKSKVVLFGTGERKYNLSQALGLMATTVAGGNWLDKATICDGRPAIQSQLFGFDFTIASDGDIYLVGYSDRFNEKQIICKISSDRKLTKFLELDYTGSEQGSIQYGLDNNFYFRENNNNPRLYRINKNGSLSLVIGNNTMEYSSASSLATESYFGLNSSYVVAPDSTIYIADKENNRIRRVDPNGRIFTIGGGEECNLEPKPFYVALKKSNLCLDGDIAIERDGSLLISEFFRISRITPAGLIINIAGDGKQESDGDGGNAMEASIYYPNNIMVANDGSIYFAESDHVIRLLSTEGKIHVIAGNRKKYVPKEIEDNGYWYPDRPVDIDGPSTAISLDLNNGYNSSLNVSPDGVVYIGEYLGIRKLSNNIPSLNFNEFGFSSIDGRELEVFDSVGRHLRTVNTATGVTIYSFGYDNAGKLNSITDASNNVTTFEWDANGLPSAIKSPFGQRTTLSVNSDGYLASVTNPAGESYRMTYDSGGLLTSFQTPRGPISTFAYDSETGRLIKDSNAGGGSQTLSNTKLSKGIEVKRTTSEGLHTRYRLENLTTGERRRKVIAPDGTQTVKLEGTDGSIKTTQVDGTLVEQLLGPDPRFGMLSPVSKSLKTTIGDLVSTITTERLAELANKDDPLSLTKLTEKVAVNGRTSTSVYTAADKTTTAKSAAGRISQTVTDNIGRVTESLITGLETVKNSYDAHGRLASVSQGSGANERLLNFAYNDQGYLASVTDPLGRSVAYQYDLAGRVTQQTLPDGNDILFNYDANGNLTALTPPGKPAHRFSYDKVDQQTQYTPPDVGAGSNSTQYSYNLDKQLTQIARPDGLTLDFVYDNAGRLKTLTTPDGAAAYSYDAVTGKLVGIDTPAGNGLDYAFNGALLTSTTWSGAVAGKVGFSYDNDFRVTGISLNDADPVAYQYDADSLLTQAGALSLSRSAENGLLTGSSLGSISDSLSYNGFGELSQYAASHNGSDLLKFSYTRDKLGRITHKKEMRGSLETEYDYAYDSAGRLAEVRKNNLLQARYSYDANGNRLQYQGSSTVNAAYDDQDRLLTYGNAGYQYTANGELKTKTVGSAVTQYQYDVLGNLKQVKLPAGKQINYLVDGQNRRIGKQVDGVLQQAFVWQDQLKPVAELDGSGNLVSRFVYATRVNVPDYMVQGGVTYRIITDHLGSPRLVVRASDGVVVQRMDYDEFGKVLDDTNPGFQPFGFAGGLYDRETGLVRFGARDYDALTGRWLSKDKLGVRGGINQYVFVNNIPTMYVDPTGYFPWILLLAYIPDAVDFIMGAFFDELTPSFGSGIGSTTGSFCRMTVTNLREWRRNRNEGIQRRIDEARGQIDIARELHGDLMLNGPQPGIDWEAQLRFSIEHRYYWEQVLTNLEGR